MLDRIPPQNIEAEASILSSILLDPEAMSVCEDILKPEHFYRTAHQKIYSTFQEIYHQKTPIDITLVVTRLKEKNQYEEIGGGSYLAELIDNIPIASNVEKYAENVRGCAKLRSLISAANKIAQAALDNSGEFEDIIDDAHKEILAVDIDAKSDTIEHISHTIQSELDRLEDLAQKKEPITGIPTGFKAIDNMTFGWQPSDLIVLAARPSMGKTALATNCMVGAAKAGFSGLKFSLEMSKAQLTHRIIAGEGNVNTEKFRNPRWFSGEEWEKIHSAASIIHKLPLYFDDSPGLKYTEIRRRARKAKKKYGIKYIIVDHLQLAKGDSGTNRDREIGSITSGLKGLAKELGIPVILLSQLNRSLESRTDKRPTMADLRDSGNIEQDSDIIVFIYRDEVYNKSEDNPHKGVAEIIFAKQRTGPTGKRKLRWDSTTTRFFDLEERY